MLRHQDGCAGCDLSLAQSYRLLVAFLCVGPVIQALTTVQHVSCPRGVGQAQEALQAIVGHDHMRGRPSLVARAEGPDVASGRRLPPIDMMSLFESH